MNYAEKFNEVFGQLKISLKASNLRVPRGSNSEIKWEFVPAVGGGGTIVVTASCRILENNLQVDNSGGAIAAFLVCLAFWIERFHLVDGKVACRLCLTYEGTRDPYQKGLKGLPQPTTLHRRRSLFILNQFKQMFADWFAYEIEHGDDWAWPENPLMNAPKAIRCNVDRFASYKDGSLRERAIELQMTNEDRQDDKLERKLLDDFPFKEAPPEKLYAQLPVGLFDGGKKASKTKAWTVGGTSEVDLWGRSPDGRILHLIELKARENRSVGIVSEAFYYARLLSYVRHRSGPLGGKIDCEDPASHGFLAAKHAENIVMWLSSPDGYHPLVCNERNAPETPLNWFNTALMTENVEFRLLPYELTGRHVTGWVR